MQTPLRAASPPETPVHTPVIICNLVSIFDIRHQRQRVGISTSTTHLQITIPIRVFSTVAEISISGVAQNYANTPIWNRHQDTPLWRLVDKRTSFSRCSPCLFPCSRKAQQKEGLFWEDLFLSSCPSCASRFLSPTSPTASAKFIDINSHFIRALEVQRARETRANPAHPLNFHLRR